MTKDPSSCAPASRRKLGEKMFSDTPWLKHISGSCIHRTEWTAVAVLLREPSKDTGAACGNP